jgi:uncharacterized SAM-binding protein YcdF (DUF218 family)
VAPAEALVSATRLVAVLGYSDRSTGELHDVCASRLARAEQEARPGDTIFLSGWARGRHRSSEARLMERAWRGRAATVLVDEGARTTGGNARRTAAAAADLGVDEVVVVTSGWHARRAGTLVRAALRGSGRTVTVVPTPDRGTRRARVRELVCWPVVPLQIAATRRNR